MSGYIGNIPTPQATQSRQSFIATAGQTTFATVGYTAGFIDLYLNGVHLLNGTDYTATNGSDIVLTTGAALNDVVEFVAYETFSVFSQTFAGTVTADDLTATDLTLSGGVYLGGTGAANKLDDYEEGTWTPTLTFGGASVNVIYTARSGVYTKIGNTVVARCVIFISNKGTSTGAATVTGLPFATNGVETAAVYGDRVSAHQITIANASTTIKLFDLPSGTATTVVATDNTDLANTTFLNYTVTYTVA